jgi:polyisoprenyl-phosphate glycosyltransferase
MVCGEIILVENIMNIVAIIPAYNEQETIGNVLSVLTKVKKLDKIIVVSDGSTDKTVNVAKKFDVEVIALEENLGKGGAMKAGLTDMSADVLLFLDADLIGLKVKHVCDLLEPVLKDEADITIGIFEEGRIVTDLAQKVIPKLSGQRALKAGILEGISDLEVTRFGVEVALNNYIKKSKVRLKKVVLRNMSHVTKEEKLGFFKGVNARMKMYWEIVNYIAKK